MLGTAWEQDFSENNFLQCRIKSKVTQWTIIKQSEKERTMNILQKFGMRTENSKSYKREVLLPSRWSIDFLKLLVNALA